jgi:hypothetical protein
MASESPRPGNDRRPDMRPPSPLRALALAAMVAALLLGLSAVFPRGGIGLPGGARLRWPALAGLLRPDTTRYAPPSRRVDSLAARLDQLAQADVRMDTTASSVPAGGVQPIEFPDSSGSALAAFFSSLRRDPGLVRVIHYGDSQIEGDRITGFLRERFQSRFGGGGVGLLPLVPVNRADGILDVDARGPWRRFTLFGRRDRHVPHNRYGALLSFSRFAPVRTDSVLHGDTTLHASVRIRPRSYSPRRCFRFHELRLLYANALRPVQASAWAGDSLVGERILEPGRELRVATWRFERPPASVRLSFQGADSPDLYGVALDDERGVAFDNVPLRGSSGTDFARSDPGLLARSYELLNVRLLILEFGDNVVPNIQKDYGFYERWMTAQIRALRRTCPSASVLVVGVPDMAQKVEDHYESYPNLELIRDAQRRAAFRGGAAFWDMYSAMGGRNTMPGWVAADPPLAAPDFTHFSPRGARVVAELLYGALMQAYERPRGGAVPDSLPA